MFKKFGFCAVIALAGTGCASTSPAAAEGATLAVQPLQIHGDLIDLTDVKIFINGDKVIDDQVSLLKGDGEFAGTWAGRPVKASCTTAAARSVAGTTCVVSVDNARATTLRF